MSAILKYDTVTHCRARLLHTAHSGQAVTHQTEQVSETSCNYTDWSDHNEYRTVH